MTKVLSIIIPFYNEEDNLPILHREIVDVLAKQKFTSEIVYVNDGSRDGSEAALQRVVNRSGNISAKLVSFRRNFGQTAALVAGIDNSEGRLVSFLDSDLQNDPADLPKFVDKLNEGYDAVFGWRKSRHDATLRSLMSKFANRLINWVFNYPYHDVGCSARIVKREFLDNLHLYGELHRIMPVLIYLKGAKVGELVVSHRNRTRGVSKYGYKRIVKTLIDIITVKFLTSYGTRPAYVFGTAGFGSFAVAFFTLITVAYKKLFLGVYVHNDPLFLVAIFLGIIGVQFIMMGLLAELQVRTYFESQNKPVYEIKSVSEY